MILRDKSGVVGVYSKKRSIYDHAGRSHGYGVDPDDKTLCRIRVHVPHSPDGGESLMPSKFAVDITREEFESFLDDYFEWKEAETEYGERVYDIPLPRDHLTIRLFSTINKSTGVSRAKGDDAIRTVIWNHDVDRPVGGREKTLRQGTPDDEQRWMVLLHRKIQDLFLGWRRFDVEMECPECGEKLAGRSSEYGEFLACSSEGCDYTEDVPDAQCSECGGWMDKRDGKYGEFLSCRDCDHTEDA